MSIVDHCFSFVCVISFVISFVLSFVVDGSQVAAAELTAQQKSLDALHEQIEASHGDEHAALMTEMNGLLEGKMEAEARAETAEGEVQRLQVFSYFLSPLSPTPPPVHGSFSSTV